MLYIISTALSLCLLFSAVLFVGASFWRYRDAIEAALRGDLGEALISERPLAACPPAARRTEWQPLRLAA